MSSKSTDIAPLQRRKVSLETATQRTSQIPTIAHFAADRFRPVTTGPMPIRKQQPRVTAAPTEDNANDAPLRNIYTVTPKPSDLHDNGLFDCSADHPTANRLSAQLTLTHHTDNGTQLNNSSETLASLVFTGANGLSAFQTLAASTYRIELDTTDRKIPLSFAIGTAIPISGKATADGVELIQMPSSIAA